MLALFSENYSGEKEDGIARSNIPKLHLHKLDEPCDRLTCSFLMCFCCLGNFWYKQVAYPFLQMCIFNYLPSFASDVIWMPRHFLDPIRYLLYVNGMFFVELAQGSYLTFTHFRSTQKHVMCMDVFIRKYGLTWSNYKIK